jgi:hypothetical protein
MKELKSFFAFWTKISLFFGGIATISSTILWLGVLLREIHPIYGPAVFLFLVATAWFAAMCTLFDEKVG